MHFHPDDFNFDSQKIGFLRSFKQELDGLLQEHENKHHLIEILKTVLEEKTTPPQPIPSLQNKIETITRMLRDENPIESTNRIALQILHADMETMVRSRIQALESGSPKTREMSQSAEATLLQETPNALPSQTVLETIELINEPQRSLQSRLNIISLFQGISPDEQEKIFFAVERIPLSQRDEAIKKALPIVTRTLSGSERAELLEITSFFPRELDSSALKFMELFKNILSANHREAMLRTLRNIPWESRVDVIKRSLPYLQKRRDFTLLRFLPLPKGIKKGLQRAAILKAVSLLPEGHRTDSTIQKLISLFQDLTNESDQERIFETIIRIPPIEREDVIEKAFPFVRNLPTGRERSYILEALGLIPQADRSNSMIQELGTLFKGMEDSTNREFLLESVREIPESQRARTIKKAAPFLRGISDGLRCSDFLTAILWIPDKEDAGISNERVAWISEEEGSRASDERGSEIRHEENSASSDEETINANIEQFVDLARDLRENNDREDVLKEIQKIHPDRRVDTIKHNASYLKNMRGIERLRFFKALSLTSEGPTANSNIQQYMTLFQRFDPEKDVSRVQNALKKLPESQRIDVIEKSTPITKLILKEPETVATILKATGLIPKEKREPVIETILQYRANIPPDILVEVFEVFALLPDQERTESNIGKFVFLFRDVNDPQCKQDLFEAILKIHKSRRTEAIEALSWFTGYKDENEKAAIFTAISLIPAMQRTGPNIQKFLSLFPKGSSGSCQEDIVHAIENIPAEHRMRVMEKSLDFIREEPDESKRAVLIGLIGLIPEKQNIEIATLKKSPIMNIKANTLCSLFFLHPEDRFRALIHLHKNPELCSGDVLPKLLSIYPDMGSNCYDYLLNRFDSELNRFSELKKYSKIVMDVKNCLLHEEYPLFETKLTDLNELKKLSSKISDAKDLLLLDKKHPLFQKVIEMQRKNASLPSDESEEFNQRKLDPFQQEQLIQVMKELPLTQVPDDIRPVIALLQGNSNPSLQEEAAQMIATLSSDQIPAGVRSLSSLLQEIPEESQLQEIFRLIKGFPESQRIYIAETIAPLFKNIPHGDLRKDILSVIKEVPLGKIDADVIRSIVELFHGIPNAMQRMAILQSVRGFPEGERIDGIRLGNAVFQGISDGYRRAVILRVMAKIPADQRTESAPSIVALFHGISDENQQKAVIAAIEAVPSTRKAAVIRKAGLFLKDITDVSLKVVMLKLIHSIFLDSMYEDIIQPVAMLLQKTANQDQRDALLQFIHKIPSHGLADIIRKTESFFKEITDVSLLMDIFEAVGNIPIDERDPDLIQSTVALFQDISDNDQRIHILQSFKNIASNQQADVLRKGKSVLLKISNGHERAVVLESIGIIPQNQRVDEVIQSIAILFRRISDTRLLQSLFSIVVYASSQRADVLRKGAPLFLAIADGYQRLSVFQVITSIPAHQRNADVIQAIGTLFQGMSDTSQRNNIIRAVTSIQPDQRVSVICKAERLFQEAPDTSQRGDLLLAVNAMAENRRTYEVIQSVVAIFEEISDENQRRDLLEGLESIPVDERVDVLQEVGPLFRTISDGSERGNILMALGNIPAGLRVDSLRGTEVLLRKLPNQLQRSDILWAIAVIPENRKTDKTIQFTATFFKGLSPGAQQKFIFSLIYDIPELQRTNESVELIGNFFQAVTSKEEQEKVLLIMRAISGNQRTEVLRSITPLLRFLAKESLRVPLLSSIAGVPENQRAAVIREIEFLFNVIKNEPAQTSLLEVLNHIPAEQRAEILRSAKPLFSEITNGSITVEILRSISVIPENQRSDVISKVTPLLKTVENVSLSYILSLIASVPENRRTPECIQSIVKLYQGIWDTYHLKDSFEAIQEIIEDQRADVIQQAELFFQDVRNDLGRADVLRLLNRIPQDQRSDPAVYRFGLSFTRMHGDTRKTVLEAFDMLSPANRKEALTLLCDNRELMRGQIFSNLISDRPEFLQNSWDYLSQELNASISNPIKARTLANRILDNTEVLLLHDEHLLLQRAIEVLTITDPDHMNDPTNPYQIFIQLKKTIESEPLWEGPGVPSSIEGTSFVINLSRLRDTRKAYTKEDLPKGIPSDGFKSLFNALRARAARNPEINREIEGIYGQSLEDLAENIVNGAFIQNNLFVPSNPGVPVGNTTFYLYAILDFLLKASSERPQNSLFSPQESALLVFSEAVRHCTTGQLDGVAQYYNGLPVECKTGAVAKTTTQEKLSVFMSAFMESALTKTLSGESLLQTLTGERAVAQMSHQTLYLKNRLCKQLGLSHRLCFDQATSCIDDRVRNMPLADLMQTVLGFCTVEKIAHDLQQELNRSLMDPKKGLAVPLDEFFDTLVSRRIGNKEDRMTYNDESNKVEISLQGAIALLEQFGYVVQNR